MLTVELLAAGGSSTATAAGAEAVGEGAAGVSGEGDGVKEDKDDEGELGAVVGVTLPGWPASTASVIGVVAGGAEIETLDAGAGDSSEGEMM